MSAAPELVDQQSWMDFHHFPNVFVGGILTILRPGSSQSFGFFCDIKQLTNQENHPPAPLCVVRALTDSLGQSSHGDRGCRMSRLPFSRWRNLCESRTPGRDVLQWNLRLVSLLWPLLSFDIMPCHGHRPQRSLIVCLSKGKEITASTIIACWYTRIWTEGGWLTSFTL